MVALPCSSSKRTATCGSGLPSRVTWPATSPNLALLQPVKARASRTKASGDGRSLIGSEGEAVVASAELVEDAPGSVGLAIPDAEVLREKVHGAVAEGELRAAGVVAAVGVGVEAVD